MKKLILKLICKIIGHNYSIKKFKGKICSRCGKYKSNYIDEGFIWRVK